MWQCLSFLVLAGPPSTDEVRPSVGRRGQPQRDTRVPGVPASPAHPPAGGSASVREPSAGGRTPPGGSRAARTRILRVEAGRNPDDRSLTDLIGELSTRSETFRTWWAAHNVRFHRTGAKQLHHPAVGDLDLTYEALEFPSDPGRRSWSTPLVYTAEPHTPTQDALQLLASWAATGPDTNPAAAASPSTTSNATDQQGEMVPIQPKQPAAKGPAEWFTGDVYIDPLVQAAEPSRVNVKRGALHPVRPERVALPRCRPDAVRHRRPGVSCSPAAARSRRSGPETSSTPRRSRHWHGAAPDHFMTHLSITEATGDERPEADWADHVTDAEYHRR